MEIKNNLRTLFALLVCVLIFSCERINYKSLEVNHSISTLKIIDSQDFIIDSLIISKDSKEYLSIALIDKNLGNEGINLGSIDSNKYKIYVNHMHELCENGADSEDLISGDLRVYIRKRGFVENIIGSEDYKNIQSFSYKYIPCLGTKVATVSAERKYK